MIITTAAVEVLSRKVHHIRRNLPLCKILGSHSSVIVNSSLFGCGAVLQGIDTGMPPASEFFLICLIMKMKAIQSFKTNGTVPLYLL